MLQQGRSLGVRAQLAKKLDYIWRSTTGNILEQTDLFCLTWGLETARSQQWGYHVLTDSDWLRLRRQNLNPEVCAVYIPKAALEKAFSDGENRYLQSRSESRGMWRYLACYSPPVAGRFSLLRNPVSCF